jgi:hypothetical protein
MKNSLQNTSTSNDFLATDENFLNGIAKFMVILGGIGMVFFGFAYFFPQKWCEWATISLWGSNSKVNPFVSMLNLCMAALALGFSLHIRSKLGWGIAQSVLLMLSFFFGLLIFIFSNNLLRFVYANEEQKKAMNPIIESLLTNVCLEILCLGMMLYLSLKSTRKAFFEVVTTADAENLPQGESDYPQARLSD